MSIKLFTDGACRGNPGPGGWGVLVQTEEGEVGHCGGERETTNNRMELRAAIEGLRLLEGDSKAILVTDSQYVRKGITEWIANWKRNGWKTSNKKPVKNVDLWQRIDAAQATHNVTWKWIKGHAGHPGNEEADRLVTQAARRESSAEPRERAKKR